MRISDMIPYERNAWDNRQGVSAIAESIREFGFRGKIKIRSKENPVIVSGHHRVLALKQLGWEELPDEHIEFCDDLTDEEVDAFRLADNETGQTGKWNRALKREEVRRLAKKVDMSKFGFDFKSKVKPYGAERLRGDHEWNLAICNRNDCSGQLELPTLKPVDVDPPDMISFNFCMSAKDYTPGVHFCIDDYQFERVWKQPAKYLDLLRKFDCVVCPDFSIYIDMPYPMKLWNLYRSRALGHWWQQEGLNVVPNVTWSDESSFEYCFDGIPQGGTIFISTVGVTRDKGSRSLTLLGMKEVKKRIKPKRVLLLGSDLGFDFGRTKVHQYKPRQFKD